MSAWDALQVGDRSVPDQLGGKLIKRIESGLVEEGSKLPSERELMELTGASRSSIRQALYDLERRGYVKRVPRVGTVVRPQDRPVVDQSLFGDLSHGQRLMREVMDLRTVVEPPITERAARRRSDNELNVLRESLEAAEAELLNPQPSATEVQRLDIAFHSGIARLTHNAMLSRLMEVTSEWMAPSRSVTLQTKRRMHRSVEAHRQIYQAIQDAEPENAASSMTDHLNDVFHVVNSLTSTD